MLSKKYIVVRELSGISGESGKQYLKFKRKFYPTFNVTNNIEFVYEIEDAHVFNHYSYLSFYIKRFLADTKRHKLDFLATIYLRLVDDLVTEDFKESMAQLRKI